MGENIHQKYHNFQVFQLFVTSPIIDQSTACFQKQLIIFEERTSLGKDKKMNEVTSNWIQLGEEFYDKVKLISFRNLVIYCEVIFFENVYFLSHLDKPKKRMLRHAWHKKTSGI